MFTIQSENLRLDLDILPVASVFAHERLVASIADHLTLEFRSTAFLENPVIVDQNLIVRDGNHRVHVFRNLQFKTIAVCRIDYMHEEARLRYWFRLLANVKSIDLLKRISEEFRGRFQYVRDKAALERIMAENFTCCGVQHGEVFGVLVFDEDVVEDAAKQERLFAPKPTRHLIPARPLHINTPTSWLREEVPLEVINQRFMEHLRAKELRRLGPGQVINGRYYE